MSTYSELRWEAEKELMLDREVYEHESHTSADDECRLCREDAEEAVLEERENHEPHEVCGLDRNCGLCEEDHNDLHIVTYAPYVDCTYCEDRWYNAQQRI